MPNLRTTAALGHPPSPTPAASPSGTPRVLSDAALCGAAGGADGRAPAVSAAPGSGTAGGAPPPCRVPHHRRPAATTTTTSTATTTVCLSGGPRSPAIPAFRRLLLLLLLMPTVLPAAAGLQPPSPRPPRAPRPPPPPFPPAPIPFGMAVLRARYPQHPWHLPVEGSDTPHGPTRSSPPPIPFVRARSDADLMLLYDENLELDLAPWRRRNRTAITVSELLRWAGGLPFKASQRVLLIKGGRLGILGQRNGSVLTCERPCDPLMDSLIADLRSWLEAAAANSSEPAWPDVAFFLNVGDTSLCQAWEAAAAAEGGGQAQGPRRRLAQQEQQQGQEPGQEPGQELGAGMGQGAAAGESGHLEWWRYRRRQRRGGSPYGPCPAPVLSVIKEWGKRKDEDVLVPITRGTRELSAAPLTYFPQQHKIDAAAFRGREYCHTKHMPYAADTCSRTYMAAMSAFNPEWSRFVDVGFVDNYTARGSDGTTRAVPAAGYVPTQELARFRYVLALDGITASSRLAQLLTFNSVVFKQTSPWIEWYYRSLVPGTHYISFWNHHRKDILQAIKYLRHKTRYLQDVSVHGQAFAYRYLSPDARRLYWRRALLEYRDLFSDMDDFVASQTVPETEANL